MTKGTPSLRRATPAELPALWALALRADAHGVSPAPDTCGPDLTHLHASAELFVACRGEHLLGFVGIARRDRTAFITDLFVDPVAQSGGIGGRLLRHALAPHHGVRRFTVSSGDPRAMALYVRHGMRPLAPQLHLRLTHRRHGQPPTRLVALLGRGDDPALLDWDARCSGRGRPADLRHWLDAERGMVLWLRRGSSVVGYALVRLQRPDQAGATIGPLGVLDAADAADAVQVALGVALERAAEARVMLDGAHPALQPLLEHGAHIIGHDTLMSDGPLPFDGMRYVASGDSLF